MTRDADVQLNQVRLSPASGVVRLAAAPAAESLTAPHAVDGGGPVLDHVNVHLLFWGRAWSSGADPSAEAVAGAVQRLLAGPYLSGLRQYRGIGSGALHGTTMVTGDDPPGRFTDHDVAHMVCREIHARRAPEPDEVSQVLYCVVMPPGVGFEHPDTIGEHSWFTFAGFDLPFDVDLDRAHHAWVTNDGTLDGITRIFSHELVESCTDPEGSAWQLPGACQQDGWCEIGDICGDTGVVDGVVVQSYWSQADGACIMPGA